MIVFTLSPPPDPASYEKTNVFRAERVFACNRLNFEFLALYSSVFVEP